MVTEDSWSTWSLESLRPCLDTVVESFGPDRLLAGSDWPVCLLATTYTRWWRTLRDYFANFSPNDRTKIFGANAIHIYNLTS
jgi:L-fuconolactonase